VSVLFVWWAVRAGWIFPLLCKAGFVYWRSVLVMLCASLLTKLWARFLFVTKCFVVPRYGAIAQNDARHNVCSR
jgi:hypothetical protein